MASRAGPPQPIRRFCGCSWPPRNFAPSTIRRSSSPPPFEGFPMLRLERIFKNYQDTGALNAQVNLYGFIDEHIFLTKSGDLGVILEVRGVDYECLDGAA